MIRPHLISFNERETKYSKFQAFLIISIKQKRKRKNYTYNPVKRAEKHKKSYEPSKRAQLYEKEKEKLEKKRENSDVLWKDMAIQEMNRKETDIWGTQNLAEGN